MPETQTLDSVSAQEAQDNLHDTVVHVSRNKARVEIHSGDHSCILISKEELASLEEALEILSNTSEVRRIAQSIAAATHTVSRG